MQSKCVFRAMECPNNMERQRAAGRFLTILFALLAFTVRKIAFMNYKQNSICKLLLIERLVLCESYLKMCCIVQQK